MRGQKKEGDQMEKSQAYELSYKTKTYLDRFFLSEAKKFTQSKNRFGILRRILRALWNQNTMREGQELFKLKNKGERSASSSSHTYIQPQS